jgi:hypothetical protein
VRCIVPAHMAEGALVIDAPDASAL